MKKYKIKLIKMFSVIRRFSIINSGYPSCVKCVNFVKPKYSGLNNKENGICKKFGEFDLVTGLISYDFANDCRYKPPYKCGSRGYSYQLNESTN